MASFNPKADGHNEDGKAISIFIPLYCNAIDGPREPFLGPKNEDPFTKLSNPFTQKRTFFLFLKGINTMKSLNEMLATIQHYTS